MQWEVERADVYSAEKKAQGSVRLIVRLQLQRTLPQSDETEKTLPPGWLQLSSDQMGVGAQWAPDPPL